MTVKGTSLSFICFWYFDRSHILIFIFEIVFQVHFSHFFLPLRRPHIHHPNSSSNSWPLLNWVLTLERFCLVCLKWNLPACFPWNQHDFLHREYYFWHEAKVRIRVYVYIYNMVTCACVLISKVRVKGQVYSKHTVMATSQAARSSTEILKMERKFTGKMFAQLHLKISSELFIKIKQFSMKKLFLKQHQRSGSG